MGAPKKPQDLVPEIFGPYENWMFKVGSVYSGIPANTGSSIIVTALAELPKGHPLLKPQTIDPIGKKGDTLAYSAVLWQDSSKKGNNITTQFAPIIVKIPKLGPRDKLFTKLRGALKNILRGQPLGGPNPSPEVGFRLNNPIPLGNFDSEFCKQKTKPTLLPDPQVVKTLSILQDSKKGIAAPLAIVAVIDDQLPFAHQITRSSDGSLRSRMEFCWLQSADIAEIAEERTVLFGREHTRHTIESLLKAYSGDEDALYRAATSNKALGEISRSVHGLWSHGAAVLDIAAGHCHADELPHRPTVEPDGNLDRVRLIGVELPTPALLDTVGFGKDCYLLSAFHYILDRADKIRDAYGQKEIPLIINLSFGFTGGPHDGTDRLEQAISELIAARNETALTRLVMPSGNSFLSAMNGEIRTADLDKNDRASICWRVQPSDRTSSYLEIWYPPSSSKKTPALPNVEGPEGMTIEPEEQDDTKRSIPGRIWLLKVRKQIIGQLTLDRFRGRTWRVMVILAPTECHDAKLAVCPAGLWKITIKAPEIKKMKGAVNCRIQRDSSPIALSKGARQSYFDDPRDQIHFFNDDGTPRHDDKKSVFARRFGTLNGLATDESIVVVGGFIKNTAEESAYPSIEASQFSSSGPIGAFSGAAGTVVCSAPADESPLMTGQRAAGARIGATARLLGTSGAAPHVTRGMAIGCLEPGTPIIIAKAPIKGLAHYPSPPKTPDYQDQSRGSVLRLGIARMTP
jgi:hypothetical protein